MGVDRCFRTRCMLYIGVLLWSSGANILECSSYKEPLMAVQDGDIIIGGLFPVHESVDLQDGANGEPSKRGCTR